MGKNKIIVLDAPELHAPGVLEKLKAYALQHNAELVIQTQKTKENGTEKR